MRKLFRRCAIGVALVMLLMVCVMAQKKETEAAEREEVYIKEKNYVKCSNDTYVTMIELPSQNVYYYAKIPKDTMIGYVTYKRTLCRDAKQKSVTINNKGYKMYQDGMVLDMTICPLKNLSFSEYSRKTGSSSYTKTKGKYIIYAASELLSAELAIPQLGSAVASSTQPTIMSGGGHIHNWSPKKSMIGSDSYNVSLGLPPSISTTIEIDKDFCTVTDKTNNATNKEKFHIQYDYVKTNLGVCGADRQDVIFEKTYAAASCWWYTADAAYTIYPVIKMKFTLCDDKVTPKTLATYENSFSLPFNMH